MRFLLLSFLMALSSTGIAHAGGEGNGGTVVEALFIREGASIINYLENEAHGQRIVKDFNLNLRDLKDTLTASRIFVVDHELYDNTGAPADAVTEHGIITLNRLKWLQALKTFPQGQRLLIFHEMLRSANIDDDNYRVSLYMSISLLPPPEPKLDGPIAPLTAMLGLDSIFVTTGSDQYPVRLVDLRLDNENSTLRIDLPRLPLSRQKEEIVFQIHLPLKQINGKILRLNQLKYWSDGDFSSEETVQVQTLAYAEKSSWPKNDVSFFLSDKVEPSFITTSPYPGDLPGDDVLVLQIRLAWVGNVSPLPLVEPVLTKLMFFFDLQ